MKERYFVAWNEQSRREGLFRLNSDGNMQCITYCKYTNCRMTENQAYADIAMYLAIENKEFKRDNIDITFGTIDKLNLLMVDEYHNSLIQ